MAKMDITIGRDLTINCGNYSSIKPSISLTVKEVDEQDMLSVYNKISETMNGLLAVEIVSLSNEMESAQEMGYKQYKQMLENAIDAQGGTDSFLSELPIYNKQKGN